MSSHLTCAAAAVGDGLGCWIGKVVGDALSAGLGAETDCVGCELCAGEPAHADASVIKIAIDKILAR
jgi:hypothetical protein